MFFTGDEDEFGYDQGETGLSSRTSGNSYGGSSLRGGSGRSGSGGGAAPARSSYSSSSSGYGRVSGNDSANYQNNDLSLYSSFDVSRDMLGR